MQEFAVMFLCELRQLPRWDFLWEETVWAIFCLAHTPTFSHLDTLPTWIDLVCGEKLWFLSRCRSDLAADDRRGDMYSRYVFVDFVGWDSNNEVWAFEMVHLTLYTRL